MRARLLMRHVGQSLLLILVFLIPVRDVVSAADDFTGKVVGVNDGDTITVLKDRIPVKVRLFGIDCPETGQDFGSRAKGATSEMAFGKVVTVHPRRNDRYGRTVADVVLPDGRTLNHELVRRGLAWVRKRRQGQGKVPGTEASRSTDLQGIGPDTNGTRIT